MSVPHWLRAVHHDGSALYLSNPLPKLGEKVQVRLRTPLNAPIEAIALRTIPDGEPHLIAMHKAERDFVSQFWTAEMTAHMPNNPYRFKLLTPSGAFIYNQLGISRAESPDLHDFRLLADYQAPQWVDTAVFYQIFPDRFFNGDPSNDVPPGAWTIGSFSTQKRNWGDAVLHFSDGGTLDFFGGDLEGIIQKLDHIKALGITALYLNPIFAARTNHRYDVTDFYQIDPYLGGNKALAKLREALDHAGMRLMLDVTLNHCGWFNKWFTDAQADENAPTAEYFTFYERPYKYEMWLGVPSLPKFNYKSQKLREALYRGQDSVLRHWLKPPYRIDGWRLDVQNMQARQGGQQLHHEVGREMRQAVKEMDAQAYLMGEHWFDATLHLQGDEMDGVMNYQGFTVPVWRWLGGHDNGLGRLPAADPTPISAETLEAQWAAFRSTIPFAIARQQFNLLDSHDTMRFLNIVGGNTNFAKVGATLLLTYLGVPSIYYGDEIGLAGDHDPDNRRCMIWEPDKWDNDLYTHYQRLIALRKSHAALVEGGYQTLQADGELFAYQRQSKTARLVIVVNREAQFNVNLPVAHGGIADGTHFVDVLTQKTFTVADGALALGNLPLGSSLILEETR
ncbi:MAG: maltodextrin glucosidase [Anaerolineae bacterium]